MSENKHYYQITIEYRSPKCNYTSAMISSTKNMPDARDALEESYHRYTDLRYQIVTAEIARVCEACNGSGKVHNKRNRLVRCPVCKGKNSHAVVETWLRLPERLWV